LQVNEDDARVGLSLKRLYPNPWEKISEKYKPGDKAQVKITSITGFGAFACLSEGIEGLIHISSIKAIYSKNELSQILYPGQTVRVEILHIDIEKRRLGLGLVEIS